MDAVTSIPRAIISYYGRLLGYAVDAGLTVVGLSENIALACIGAALGGMQVVGLSTLPPPVGFGYRA